MLKTKVMKTQIHHFLITLLNFDIIYSFRLYMFIVSI